MRPKIIAFCGVKTSGKTTAFGMIKQIIPGVEEITLAKKIKDVCSDVFKIDRASFDDQNLKELEMDPPIFLSNSVIVEVLKAYGVSTNFEKYVRKHIGKICFSRRELLQYIGTDILRDIDSNIHCKVCTNNLDSNKIYVLTDLRFPDEHSFFNDLDCDFHPFYIKNNRAESLASSDKHPSEVLVMQTAKKCVQLDNNRTLADLQDLLTKTVKGLL